MDLYYLRQITLLGEKAQEQLQNSCVAIIGCGALGSAVAHFLARIGVGMLILIDGDTVERHNLARQHLYTLQDIGTSKVDALEKHLRSINEHVQVKTYNYYLQTTEQMTILDTCDVICDGLDTHAGRWMIDMYSKKRSLWWVHGAAIMEQGTIVAFNGTNRTYDKIYSTKAVDTHCADTGVIVTTTTIVASLQTQVICNILLQKEIPWELIKVNGIHVTTYPIK